MAHKSPVAGVFISVEGGDGAGKSTQIKILADKIRENGRDVVLTREPGGSPGAESIRELLVTGAAERWSPMCEALMMYAARADHLAKTIEPALENGSVVISDRFADSSMAYQGIAGALGADIVTKLHDIVVADRDPDLTLILDIPIDEGLARAVTRGGADRFESKGTEFQARVRKAFLQIASDNPKRCAVIDARGDIDAIAERIDRTIKDRLPGLLPCAKNA